MVKTKNAIYDNFTAFNPPNNMTYESLSNEEYAELLHIVKNSRDTDWQDLSYIED